MVKKWLLPPGIYEGLSAIKQSLNGPGTEAQLRGFQSNLQFKNIYKNQTVFICATGPSINTQDLSCLIGRYAISVSSFFLHPLARKIAPCAHVFASNHKPFRFENLDHYYSGIRKQLPPETPIFAGNLPYEYGHLEYLSTHPQMMPKSFHLLPVKEGECLSENNFRDDRLWDIARSVFVARTVLYHALQIAFYMGFDKIVLLGCDHDYLNDTARVANHHFYSEGSGFSDANHLGQFTSERWFYEYYSRWRDYRLMDTFCRERGVRIYNATEGGMLDVFERAKLSLLIS